MIGRLSDTELEDYRIATHRKDGRMLVGKYDMHAEMMRDKLFAHIDAITSDLAAANAENKRLTRELAEIESDLQAMAEQFDDDSEVADLSDSTKKVKLPAIGRVHRSLGKMNLDLQAAQRKLASAQQRLAESESACHHLAIMANEGLVLSVIGARQCEGDAQEEERLERELAEAKAKAERLDKLEAQLKVGEAELCTFVRSRGFQWEDAAGPVYNLGSAVGQMGHAIDRLHEQLAAAQQQLSSLAVDPAKREELANSAWHKWHVAFIGRPPRDKGEFPELLSGDGMRAWLAVVDYLVPLGRASVHEVADLQRQLTEANQRLAELTKPADEEELGGIAYAEYYRDLSNPTKAWMNAAQAVAARVRNPLLQQIAELTAKWSGVRERAREFLAFDYKPETPEAGTAWARLVVAVSDKQPAAPSPSHANPAASEPLDHSGDAAENVEAAQQWRVRWSNAHGLQESLRAFESSAAAHLWARDKLGIEASWTVYPCDDKQPERRFVCPACGEQSGISIVAIVHNPDCTWGQAKTPEVAAAQATGEAGEGSDDEVDMWFIVGESEDGDFYATEVWEDESEAQENAEETGGEIVEVVRKSDYDAAVASNAAMRGVLQRHVDSIKEHWDDDRTYVVGRYVWDDLKATLATDAGVNLLAELDALREMFNRVCEYRLAKYRGEIGWDGFYTAILEAEQMVRNALATLDQAAQPAEDGR